MAWNALDESIYQQVNFGPEYHNFDTVTAGVDSMIPCAHKSLATFAFVVNFFGQSADLTFDVVLAPLRFGLVTVYLVLS